MPILRAKNPDMRDFERTKLSSTVAAATVSLSVDSSEGFEVNDWVVVGDLGAETAEAVRVTAVTNSTTLAVTALTYAHSVDEPVVKTFFNRINFYSNVDNYDDPIVAADVDWANPNSFTVYNDTTGNANTKYKYSFYNSQTSVESSLSSEFGVPVYYCSVNDVADYLNLDVSQESGDLKPWQIAKVIRNVTKSIDSWTNTSFTSQVVSTSSYEYHDGKKSTDNIYFLDNKPVISVQSLQVSTSDETVGPGDATWNSLTEDSDFTVDKRAGAVTIPDVLNSPRKGDNRLRVAYTWGHGSVPDDVRRLAVLMSAKDLALSNLTRNAVTDTEKSINFADLNREIDLIRRTYTFGGLFNS